MATFDTPVPVMQPNQNLENFSRGTNSLNLQPLAEVPKLSEKYVQPDYKANTSVGKGLEGLGVDISDDIGLATGIIKQNIDDTLNTGINKIRDSFGVAQAADTANGFASAVGRGGADGVSLTDDKPKTPVEVQKLGNRLDGLTEAYKQGELSNSAYYGKIEAYTRQVIQQFPGFADDVREMATQKVGTNSANALRSSIQQDVTELQKKVNAQNDKQTTYEHTNAGYIGQLYPNYFTMKANGTAPSFTELQDKVTTLAARDASLSSKTASLAASKAEGAAISENAQSIAIQRGGDIANTLIVGMQNDMGIKNASDFTQVLNDVRSGKRAPLTPDEKKTLTGVYGILEQQYGIQFDKFMSTPLNHNTTETVASKIGDPTKVAAIRTQGMSTLTDLKNGLLNEQYGVVAQTSNWSKATNEAGEGDFLRRAPIAPYVAAGRKALGDQGIMTLETKAPYMVNGMLEGFRQFNQAALATGDKSLRQVFDTYKAENVNDGELVRKSISDGVNTILHSDKMADKSVGVNAVKHVFGPDNRTLLNAFNDKNQVSVFNDLVSKPIVDKISKMDGVSKQYFRDFADDSFTTVYEAQMATAASTALAYKASNNLKVVYDPGTANFGFVKDSVLPGYGNAGIISAANQKLSGLNSAINSMKEVFKMEGRDPTEALHTLLPIAGIQPGTPLYKALDDEFQKSISDNIKKAQGKT